MPDKRVKVLMLLPRGHLFKFIHIFLFFVLTWESTGSHAANAPYEKPFEMPVSARIIPTFFPAEPNKTIFGRLEFLSGLELLSSSEHFGGYSGFGFLEGSDRFVAISDLGFWLTGVLERKDGLLHGISDATAAPIRGLDGKLLPGKWSADAEGLALIGDTALLTFERNHRVEFHELDFVNFNGPSRPFAGQFSNLRLRGNKGLEAVAAVPNNLNLDFEYLFFAERSLNSQGNLRAFLSAKGMLREFSVKREKDFDITSAAFLPDGSLVLLERRYNIANGVALRIRVADASSIKAGSVLDGEVLMEADMAYQIDNFEGLAVSQNDAGETILTIISDDNHFILQRTLLLEFRLLD